MTFIDSECLKQASQTLLLILLLVLLTHEGRRASHKEGRKTCKKPKFGNFFYVLNDCTKLITEKQLAITRPFCPTLVSEFDQRDKIHTNTHTHSVIPLYNS